MQWNANDIYNHCYTHMAVYHGRLLIMAIKRNTGNLSEHISRKKSKARRIKRRDATTKKTGWSATIKSKAKWKRAMGKK